MKSSSDLNQLLQNSPSQTPTAIARATAIPAPSPTRVLTLAPHCLGCSAGVAPCEAMSAPSPGRKSPFDQQDIQVIAEGRKIYTDYCAVCHGAEGRGDGIGAVILDIQPGDFTDAVFMRRMPTDCEFALISEGIPGKSMPAWKHLGEDAIWKVLHYERGFARP